MKKYFLSFFSVLVLALSLIAADLPPLSTESIREIHVIQLDIERTQKQALQLQIQYTNVQNQLQHDAAELETSKARALKAANLDGKDYDVDIEKLIFILKPKTPVVPVKAEEKK